MEYFTLKEQWICSLCHKPYLLCYFSFQAPSSVLLSNTVLTDTKAPSFKFRSPAAVINRYIAFVSIHTLAHHFFALLSQKGLRKKEALPGLHTSYVCVSHKELSGLTVPLRLVMASKENTGCISRMLLLK